jgi:hypothetical protein
MKHSIKNTPNRYSDYANQSIVEKAAPIASSKMEWCIRKSSNHCKKHSGITAFIVERAVYEDIRFFFLIYDLATIRIFDYIT